MHVLAVHQERFMKLRDVLDGGCAHDTTRDDTCAHDIVPGLRSRPFTLRKADPAIYFLTLLNKYPVNYLVLKRLQSESLPGIVASFSPAASPTA